MKPSDYPRPYLMLYGVHQAFLQLGFKSDDLYVSLSNIINLNKKNVLCLRLETQGKEFVYTVAAMGDDAVEKEVLNTWKSFATLVTDPEKTTIEELEALLESTGLNTITKLQLAATLAQKGFEVPGVPNAKDLTLLARPQPKAVGLG